MKKIYSYHFLLVCIALLLFQSGGVNTQAQQQSQNPPPPPITQQQADDEVLRISTDLVQTGVSVFDKHGKFVEGLKKEDFELKVDGSPVDVGFFERIAAGSVREETQMAASRGDSRPTEPAKSTV